MPQHILCYHVEPQDLLQSLPLKQSIILPLSFVFYALKHSIPEWQVASSATNLLCIHLGSLDTKIIYIELFQKKFSYPSMSLSSSIDFHLQPCSKVSGLHQGPHVCVIPWVSSEIVQGIFSFAHMILPIMCISSGCKMSLHSLCLVLRILPCIPWCFNLLHDGTMNFSSSLYTAS